MSRLISLLGSSGLDCAAKRSGGVAELSLVD
jgi:hypothetical protein